MQAFNRNDMKMQHNAFMNCHFKIKMSCIGRSAMEAQQ
jgi:hypothetical protein